MQDQAYTRIGRSLFHFQAALESDGSSLGEFIERHYVDRWRSDALYNVMAVRTAFLMGMQNYLVSEGLLNLERVQLSLVTDPLNHDVEHTPSIPYKGQPYVATHSMIYSKFLACHSERLRGVWVDSPNIRLEIASPDGAQRGKYLIDFSQLDVELRRGRNLTLDDYFDRPDFVSEVLREDHQSAMRFFEAMFRAGIERVLSGCAESLKDLGVGIDLPDEPFPVFFLDEALARHSKHEVEERLGEETEAPFFWIAGLMRENYDLIYPYLSRDGSRRPLNSFSSREIYNYDLCVKSRPSGAAATGAREVLSGAVREWLFEPMVARLLDHRVLPVAPEMQDGTIRNIDEMGGYGPFLTVAARRGADGRSTFPETFGGGIGIERALWALLRGPEIRNIEDVMCFGKNPDSHPIYLF